MHWRQREMLFEQTEALKGNLEEKRQPEYTGFGDKSPKMREPDARLASKSGKRRTGGGLQGPGKKKRRRFEDMSEERPMPRGAGKTRRKTRTTYQDQRLKTSGPTKEGKQLKERVPAGALKAIKRKLTTGPKDPKKKKKTESHCEAYAEAYVRGVEAALRESKKKLDESLLLEFRPVAPFTVEFDMGSLNRLQSAISNGETQFDVGGGYMIPVSLFLNRDGSINTQIVNNLFGSALTEFSDILGVDVPIIPPTGPSLDDPIFPVRPTKKDAMVYSRPLPRGKPRIPQPKGPSL